jgi:hypothetical protein
MNETEISLYLGKELDINSTVFGVLFLPMTYFSEPEIFTIDDTVFGSETMNQTLLVFPYAYSGIILYSPYAGLIGNEIKSSLSLFRLTINIPISYSEVNDLQLLIDVEQEYYNRVIDILTASSFDFNLLILERILFGYIEEIESGSFLGRIANLFEDMIGILGIILISSILFQIFYLKSRSRTREILMIRGSTFFNIFVYFSRSTLNTFTINILIVNISILIISFQKEITHYFTTQLFGFGNLLIFFLFCLSMSVDALYHKYYTGYKKYFLINKEINLTGNIKQGLLILSIIGLVSLIILALFSSIFSIFANPFASSSSIGNSILRSTLSVISFWIILSKTSIINLLLHKISKLEFDVIGVIFKKFKMITIIFPILLILSLSIHATSVSWNSQSVQRFEENEDLYYFGDLHIGTGDLDNNLSSYISWIENQDIISDYGFIATLNTYENTSSFEITPDLHVIVNCDYFIDNANITDAYFEDSVDSLIRIGEDPNLSISAKTSNPSKNSNKRFLGMETGQFRSIEIQTTIIDQIKFNIPGLSLLEGSLIVSNNTIPLSLISIHKGQLFISFVNNSTRVDQDLFVEESYAIFGLRGGFTDLNEGDIEQREDLIASSNLILILSWTLSSVLIFIHLLVMLSESEKIGDNMRKLWMKGYAKSELYLKLVKVGLLNLLLDLLFVVIISYVVISSTVNVNQYSIVSEWVTFKEFALGTILPVFSGILISYTYLMKKVIRRISI